MGLTERAPEVNLDKATEFFTKIGHSAEWVRNRYETFISNYPSGQATRDQVIVRLKDVARYKFPNLDPADLAANIYVAFDKAATAISSQRPGAWPSSAAAVPTTKPSYFSASTPSLSVASASTSTLS